MGLLNDLKVKVVKFGQRWSLDTSHGLRIDYKKKVSVDENFYKNLTKKRLMRKKADVHAKLAELG